MYVRASFLSDYTHSHCIGQFPTSVSIPLPARIFEGRTGDGYAYAHADIMQDIYIP
jgi:hypothetical protein